MAAANKPLTIVSALLFVVFALQATLGGEPAPAEADVWAQLAKYKFGDNEKILISAADIVMKAAADPAKKQNAEAKLAGLLDTGTPDAKRFVCRQLWIVGTAQSVPALARLLADEQLSDAARYGLERMQDPAAGAALRDAVGKLKGQPLVGAIDSIGARRDRQAAAVLAPLLGNTDPAVAAAAAWALGRIGSTEAAAAIAGARGRADAKLKRVLDDAYLMAADALAADGKREEATAIYRQMIGADQPRRVRVAAVRGLANVHPEKTPPPTPEKK